MSWTAPWWEGAWNVKCFCFRGTSGEVNHATEWAQPWTGISLWVRCKWWNTFRWEMSGREEIRLWFFVSQKSQVLDALWQSVAQEIELSYCVSFRLYALTSDARWHSTENSNCRPKFLLHCTESPHLLLKLKYKWRGNLYRISLLRHPKCFTHDCAWYF
jgi:hypothetical protein